jgi:hypothetical protein
MEYHSTTTGRLLVVGDFNFHVDQSDAPNVGNFTRVLEAAGLQQHVHEPTHKQGHTLDLLITRNTEDTISDVRVQDDLGLVHFSVMCSIKFTRSARIKKYITYRKLKTINLSEFKSDIHLPVNFDGTAEELLDCYNQVISDAIEKHAPLKSAKVTLRDSTPWQNDDIKTARTERRRAERKWRSSRLTVHRQIYLESRRNVTHLIRSAKFQYYSNLVHENSADQKALFGIINRLLYKDNKNPMPQHSSDEELANKFASFFSDKITSIVRELSPLASSNNSEHDKLSSSFTFTKFTLPTIEEVRKTVIKSPTKSCCMDPLPTWLLKECIDELAPIVTKIASLSMLSGIVPHQMKKAVVTPLHKKPQLDTCLKNYRPVSNLSFISKVVERLIASQINDYLSIHGLNEPFQSAYRKAHSTETALIRVQNDLLMALDKQHIAILIMLDLSSAFDTVCHKQLLNRLHLSFGIGGLALKWLQSYLDSRSQIVAINQSKSDSFILDYGVPQGSVLGPLLFTLYTSPLGMIIKKYQLHYHLYADDTQLYMAFKPAKCHADLSVQLIEQCIKDICSWMTNNNLKINDNKTEIMIMGKRQQRCKLSFSPLKIGSSMIEPGETSSVRNLGVWFDSELSMSKHVTNVCQAAHFHLRNLGSIRKYLTRTVSEQLTHAFVSSKLDYGNALLYGIPATLLNKLQLIQNTAARIVTRTGKYEHITPVLKHLHWLPVRERIVFKILLVTFKAINNQAPNYICDLLDTYRPSHHLRSKDKFLLVVPKTKLKTCGSRAFTAAAPTLWNALPQNVKSSESISVFKSRLKTFLFTRCYNN